jgi:hypothetical protein
MGNKRSVEPQEMESNYNICKAGQILQAIRHIADRADGDCGDVEASSNWLVLIEAAATHAHFLITGCNLDEKLVERPPHVNG